MKIKLLLKISILILLLSFIFNNKIYAQSHTYSASDLIVSYNHCDGYVTLKFLAYVDVDANTNDDQFCNGKLYIKIGTLPEFQIGSFDDTSGEYSADPNGETQYYDRVPEGDGHQIISCVEEGDDGDYFYWIVHYLLPTPTYDNYWGDNITFRIEGDWDCNTFVDFSQSISTSQISPPTDFTASNDVLCDRVDLNWKNPTDVICPSTQYVTEIWRGGLYLTEVAFPAESYSDISAVKGQVYDYKVRTR